MHEQDWIAVPHKHSKQFGVMVKVPDSYTRDLGSIPAQVSKSFEKFFLLNSSN